MARGYTGAFGRSINDAWIWLLALRASSCSGSPTSAGRCRCGTSTCSALLSFGPPSTTSTGATSSRRCRSSTRRCSTCSGAWSGSAARARASATSPIWPVWVLLAATVFLAGFRFGLNVEASNVIDVGLRERHRRAADRRRRGDAVRPHAGRRPARNAAPRTPTATSASTSRRTAAASRPTGGATRTGPSPISPTCPATSRIGCDGKWDAPAGRALRRRSSGTRSR